MNVHKYHDNTDRWLTAALLTGAVIVIGAAICFAVMIAGTVAPLLARGGR